MKKLAIALSLLFMGPTQVFSNETETNFLKIECEEIKDLLPLVYFEHLRMMKATEQNSTSVIKDSAAKILVHLAQHQGASQSASENCMGVANNIFNLSSQLYRKKVLGPKSKKLMDDLSQNVAMWSYLTGYSHMRWARQITVFTAE